MAGRTLELRSGGWLLILAGILVLVTAVRLVVPGLGRTERTIGDGTTPASYGFDLEPIDVPRATFVAAGVAKNEIPSLVDPDWMAADDVAAFNEDHRGKYLIDSDRVIGVVLDGEARAYPLRVLNWHEVVNDDLGDVPIAVTYHPLCGSVVVFDRRVEGEVLEFGVSGLLDNSNLLLFDRRSDPVEESLWSQLRARAVAGPARAAGKQLRVLTASLARWEVWKSAQPQTTVLRPDEAWVKRYQKNPYGNYFLTGKPRFPVAPLTDPAGSRMDRILALDGGAGQRLLLLAPDTASPAGLPDGLRWVPAPDGEPPSVLVDPDAGVPTRYSFWFAWHAQYPAAARPGSGSPSPRSP